MKVASRVFAIIGIVAACIIIFYGAIGLGLLKAVDLNDPVLQSFAGVYIGYGIYALIVSIGCLSSISGSSKGVVIFWGVLNIPVMLIGSIFMFCIKPEDLY